MKFFEVEPGITINIASISKFEDDYLGGTVVTFRSGEQTKIHLAYDVFRNLINQTSNIERNIERSVAQIASNQRFATP